MSQLHSVLSWEDLNVWERVKWLRQDCLWLFIPRAGTRSSGAEIIHWCANIGLPVRLGFITTLVTSGFKTTTIDLKV